MPVTSWLLPNRGESNLQRDVEKRFPAWERPINLVGCTIRWVLE